jgi:hypothetical protein
MQNRLMNYLETQLNDQFNGKVKKNVVPFPGSLTSWIIPQRFSI